MKNTYNKEDLINDIKINLSLKELMKKYNVSRATIYRMKKIIETESEETNNNNISNNNISNNNVSVNDD
jgi:Mor family transcriptional regulator